MEAAERHRYRRVYDAVARLSGRRLPGSDLFTELSGQLRCAVPFRTGGWLRLDPATLLPMPGLLLQASHDRASRPRPGPARRQVFLPLASESLFARSIGITTTTSPSCS